MDRNTDRYNAREFPQVRPGRTGTYERPTPHALTAPTRPGTTPDPHPAGPDRPGPVAELPGVARGRRRAPSTRDPGARDESVLETRADELYGQCERNDGDLERPVPGPGTGASGRALGGGWRDHLATCQGSKVPVRARMEGRSGQGEARRGS